MVVDAVVMDAVRANIVTTKPTSRTPFVFIVVKKLGPLASPIQ